MLDFGQHVISAWFVGDYPVVTEGELMKLAVAFFAHLNLVASEIAKYLFDCRLIIATWEVDVVGRCLLQSFPSLS